MGNELEQLRAELNESIVVKQRIVSDPQLMAAVLAVARCVSDALAAGQRILLAGNGGSAADAQHIATEFVSRYLIDRRGLPALSLSTDTSMLTAIGNDYGFDLLFRRQLEAQARRGDVFIGITTSGRSRNVLEAFEACRPLGVVSVALCGQGGQLEGRVDHLIRVPSAVTARIQEAHITLAHLICGYAERRLFAGPPGAG